MRGLWLLDWVKQDEKEKENFRESLIKHVKILMMQLIILVNKSNAKKNVKWKKIIDISVV